MSSTFWVFQVEVSVLVEKYQPSAWFSYATAKSRVALTRVPLGYNCSNRLFIEASQRFVSCVLSPLLFFRNRLVCGGGATRDFALSLNQSLHPTSSISNQGRDFAARNCKRRSWSHKQLLKIAIGGCVSRGAKKKWFDCGFKEPAGLPSLLFSSDSSSAFPFNFLFPCLHFITGTSGIFVFIFYFVGGGGVVFLCFLPVHSFHTSPVGNYGKAIY